MKFNLSGNYKPLAIFGIIIIIAIFIPLSIFAIQYYVHDGRTGSIVFTIFMDIIIGLLVDDLIDKCKKI